MSSGLLAIFIVLVVIAAAAAVTVLLWPMVRRRQLRSKFGSEYDRTVQELEDRRAAERELTERERRHAKLPLRELTTEERQQYTAEWTAVQEHFVDDPAAALTEADALVTMVMAQRGYPTESYDQQVADLSVEHAEPLGHYRAAHQITTRSADTGVSTEDMRTAIVHYRELFQDLVNGADGDTEAQDTGTDKKAEPDRKTELDDKTPHGAETEPALEASDGHKTNGAPSAEHNTKAEHDKKATS